MSAVTTRRPPLRPTRGPSRTAAALLAGALLTVLSGLAGCSSAQDTVSTATAGAKSQAASVAQDAATKAVRSQICRLVQDGQVSAQDRASLKDLVGRAAQVGVPDDVLRPAKELVDAGASAGADSMAELRSSCASG